MAPQPMQSLTDTRCLFVCGFGAQTAARHLCRCSRLLYSRLQCLYNQQVRCKATVTVTAITTVTVTAAHMEGNLLALLAPPQNTLSSTVAEGNVWHDARRRQLPRYHWPHMDAPLWVRPRHSHRTCRGRAGVLFPSSTPHHSPPSLAPP